MSGTVLGPDGRPVDVGPENLEEVVKNLRAGTFTLPEDLSVVDKRGNLSSMKSADSVDFVRQVLSGQTDFRLATRAEVSKIEQEEEFGDRPIAAGAAGLARGATFGLSDKALVESGVDPETLAGLRAANPGVSTATEVVGAVAPALVPGAGALGAAARLTPAGALGRLGVAAEGAVARAAIPASAGLARRAATRGAAVGTIGAAEGAAFGAGEAVTEAALGDIPLTAESVQAHAANGALFGGVGGAALGGLVGAVGRNADTLVSKGGAVTPEARQAVKELVSPQVGAEVADSTADLIVRSTEPSLAQRLTGSLAAGIVRRRGLGDDLAATANRAAVDPEFARLATRSREVIEEAAPRIRQSLDEFVELTDSVADISTARAKPAMFERSVDIPLTAPTKQAALDLLDETRRVAARMQDKGIYGASGPRVSKRIMETLESIEPTIRPSGDAAEMLTVRGAVEQATAMDMIKRRLGRFRKRVDPNTEAEIEELYEQFRLHLEEESIYGGGALAQKETNAELSAMIAADEAFRPRFLTKSGRKSKHDPWRNQLVVDSKKLQGWTSTTGTEGGASLDDALRQAIGSRQRFFDVIRKHYDLDPRTAAIIDKELPRLQKQLQADLDKVAETVQARNQFQALQQATEADALGRALSGGGPLSSGLLGGLLGGPGGVVAGVAGQAAVQALRKPGTFAAAVGSRAMPRKLLQAKTAQVITQARIDRGTTAAVLGKKSVKPSAVPATLALVQAKGLTVAYQDRVAQVLAATADPQGVENAAAVHASGLEDDAPQVAMALQQGTVRAVTYLRSQVPPASEPDPQLPEETPPPASPAEMLGFVQKAAVAEDPARVAELLPSKAVSPDHMEALQAMYPLLAQRMVQDVQTKLAAMPDATYETRMALSAMLGIKTHRTLDPANPSAPQVPPEEQAPAQGRPAPKKVLKADLDGDADAPESVGLHTRTR